MFLAVAAASLATISGAAAMKPPTLATMQSNHKPPAILAFSRGDASAIRSSVIDVLILVPPCPCIESSVRAKQIGPQSVAGIRIQRRRLPRAIMKSLADSFPFLRRHRLTAFAHSPSRTGAMTTTKTKASEQNSAESQQSDSLPEGN